MFDYQIGLVSEGGYCKIYNSNFIYSPCFISEKCMVDRFARGEIKEEVKRVGTKRSVDWKRETLLKQRPIWLVY